MRISVVHNWDGDSGVMRPVSLLLDSQLFDWTRSLFIRLEAPFEHHDFDESDTDALSLTVPDHVYVRHPDFPSEIGIHMPALRQHAERHLALFDWPVSTLDIRRLLLRLSDVEDVLRIEFGQMGRNDWNTSF